MSKKKPFSQALLEFVQANPGVIFTLTPEQLAEQTGYTLKEAQEYYRGIAAEKQRLAAEAEKERIGAAEAEVITWMPPSQCVRVLYYPRLGEVRIESTYQRKRKYAQDDEDEGWDWRKDRQNVDTVLLPPQDSIDLGIYLSGLQPHIRETQARLASEPEPPEPELPETYIPYVTPPDKMRLSEFARTHGISATEAVKYFEKHLIAGEREQNPRSLSNSKTVDSVIIYAQGQYEAWQQLHTLPNFQNCPQCPHAVEVDEEASAPTEEMEE